MRLALEIVGVPEVAEGIEDGYMRMYLAAYNAMRREMVNQRSYTLSTHMHGPTGATTVRQLTGNLARSLVSQVEDDDSAITGVVGFPEGNLAPYARILHEGGTFRSRLGTGHSTRERITAKHNKATVTIPARPYLLAAFEERTSQIKASLTKALLNSIK